MLQFRPTTQRCREIFNKIFNKKFPENFTPAKFHRILHNHYFTCSKPVRSVSVLNASLWQLTHRALCVCVEHASCDKNDREQQQRIVQSVDKGRAYVLSRHYSRIEALSITLAQCFDLSAASLAELLLLRCMTIEKSMERNRVLVCTCI